MTTCKACGAPIFWATTETGDNLPMNAEADPGGTFLVNFDLEAPWSLRPQVRSILKPFSWTTPNDPRYTSHFATCPQADPHRTKT